MHCWNQHVLGALRGRQQQTTNTQRPLHTIPTSVNSKLGKKVNPEFTMIQQTKHKCKSKIQQRDYPKRESNIKICWNFKRQKCLSKNQQSTQWTLIDITIYNNTTYFQLNATNWRAMKRVNEVWWEKLVNYYDKVVVRIFKPIKLLLTDRRRRTDLSLLVSD